jgi:hypothetical protein
MSSTALQDAIALINQLSPDDQRALLRTLQDRLGDSDQPAETDRHLEGAQLTFMFQHRDEIEAACACDSMVVLDDLECSEEYRALFGDMPWDEAYDRFEETWWTNRDVYLLIRS